MTWKLSDGTEVELGGIVRGESVLARALRRDVERVRIGVPPRVTLLAPGSEDLDLDSAEHVDAWLRNEARLEQPAAELVSAPHFKRRTRPAYKYRDDVEY